MVRKSILKNLNGIFHDRSETLRDFLNEGPRPSLRIFLDLHLPLLLLYPIYLFLCPYCRYKGVAFTATRALVGPLFAMGVVGFMMLFDKVLEHREVEELWPPKKVPLKNISLFLSFSVSAAGAFFLIHPTLGYIMLFLATLYSLSSAILENSHLRDLHPSRTIMALLSTTLLVSLPLLIIALIFNFLRTLQLFQTL